MSASREPLPRRAMLVAALGSLGAAVAATLGRPMATRAADGDPMVVGGEYTAESATVLRNQTNNNTVFLASTDGQGAAIGGHSAGGAGLNGTSAAGNGVVGTSLSGIGVGGQGYESGVDGSTSVGVGVRGSSSGQAPGIGVIGQSISRKTGVYGLIPPDSGPMPPAPERTGVYGYSGVDAGSVGVRGDSPAGYGVYGKSTTGYAGVFNGRVLTYRHYELWEIATPAAPPANRVVLFARDNGAGRTQLCARFHTGAVKVLATE